MEIPQKPPQNDMTDFPPHFTTTNYDTGIVTVGFCSGSQFCDPSRHFSFIVAPLTLFPLSVSSLSLRPPLALIPVRESVQEK